MSRNEIHCVFFHSCCTYQLGSKRQKKSPPPMAAAGILGPDLVRSLEIGSSIVSYRGEIIGMPQMEFRD